MIHSSAYTGYKSSVWGNKPFIVFESNSKTLQSLVMAPQDITSIVVKEGGGSLYSALNIMIEAYRRGLTIHLELAVSAGNLYAYYSKSVVDPSCKHYMHGMYLGKKPVTSEKVSNTNWQELSDYAMSLVDNVELKDCFTRDFKPFLLATKNYNAKLIADSIDLSEEERNAVLGVYKPYSLIEFIETYSKL